MDLFNPKTPLIEDNANEQMRNLEEIFREFSRNFEDIKDFNLNMKGMNVKDYKRMKPEIHKKIGNTPGLLESINTIVLRLRNYEVKDLIMKVFM